MRGKSNIKVTSTDLNFIFYKLRACRGGARSPERRSWMRLARAQLKIQRPDLTDQDRHEIMCVWSRDDCIYFNSPAMVKLLGPRARRDDAEWLKSPKTVYRAAFDIHGRKTKKTRKVRVSTGTYAPIVVPVRTLRVQRVVVPPRSLPPPSLLGILLGRVALKPVESLRH